MLQNGADISPEENAKFADEAAKWETTPYGSYPGAYAGNRAVRGVGADCSGSVWKIHGNVGYSYPYTTTHDFGAAAMSPAFPFRKLKLDEVPQRGDVVLYPGHMSIYDGNNMVWSAHAPGRAFANSTLGTFKGMWGFYRFQVPAATTQKPAS